MNKENFESIITETRSNMKELSADNTSEMARECGKAIMCAVLDDKNNEAEHIVAGSVQHTMAAFSLLAGATLNAVLESGIGIEQAGILIHRIVEAGLKGYIEYHNKDKGKDKTPKKNKITEIVEFNPKK